MKDDTQIWRDARAELLSGFGGSYAMRVIVKSIDDLNSIYGSGFAIPSALSYLATLKDFATVTERQIKRVRDESWPTTAAIGLSAADEHERTKP